MPAEEAAKEKRRGRPLAALRHSVERKLEEAFLPWVILELKKAGTTVKHKDKLVLSVLGRGNAKRVDENNSLTAFRLALVLKRIARPSG